MKKEEFPTFLNEQPSVIFGRTERELLIMACGIVLGYTTWQNLKGLIPGVGGEALAIVLALLLVALSIVVALVSIGKRPLEEWFFCWLLYVMVPKVYLYKPLEDEAEQVDLQERSRMRDRNGDIGDMEGDESDGLEED